MAIQNESSICISFTGGDVGWLTPVGWTPEIKPKPFTTPTLGHRHREGREPTPKTRSKTRMGRRKVGIYFPCLYRCKVTSQVGAKPLVNGHVGLRVRRPPSGI